MGPLALCRQPTQTVEATERTGRTAETCATSEDQSMHGWWSCVSCCVYQPVPCEIQTGPGRRRRSVTNDHMVAHGLWLGVLL